MSDFAEPPTLIKNAASPGFSRGAFADGDGRAVPTPIPGNITSGAPSDEDEAILDASYFQGAGPEPVSIRRPNAAQPKPSAPGWVRLGRHYYSDFAGLLWRSTDPSNPELCCVLTSAEWTPAEDLREIIASRISDGRDRLTPTIQPQQPQQPQQQPSPQRLANPPQPLQPSQQIETDFTLATSRSPYVPSDDAPDSAWIDAAAPAARADHGPEEGSGPGESEAGSGRETPGAPVPVSKAGVRKAVSRVRAATIGSGPAT